MDTPAGTPPPSLQYLELVTSAQRLLYSVLWSLLGNNHDVDDVLQETNLVLWSKAAEYDPWQPFQPWALRIAQNQVLAFRKRQQRSKRMLLDDELIKQLASDAIEELEGLNSRRKALEECLTKLTDEQRALVLSRYDTEGSVQRIASEQGRSPKAVSEALRRIRAALLACVERSLARRVLA